MSATPPISTRRDTCVKGDVVAAGECGVPAPLESLAACRAITRREARNFYYGLALTPEPRRSAVFSIYAWMRAADDVVDRPAPVETRRADLEAFAARTRAALDGGGEAEQNEATPNGQSHELFWPAFAWTIARFGIDRAHLDDMLAGLREDLDHAGYATRSELDRYCYRVASTVGQVCVAIWGLRAGADAESARGLAIDRGRAFQLTNILRDIAQDFDDLPRRVYIPQELLEKHGLTAIALRRWSDAPACTALVRELAGDARALYERSSPLESLIDPACAPALWGMTRIYRGLLDLIEADPAAVVGTKRLRLSSTRKGLIALSAMVRARAGGWAAR